MMDYFTGDETGMPLPAHIGALRVGGADFLNTAFARFGSLPAPNRVVAIREIASCPGGSTGAKFFVTVEWAKPGAHARLFVKFSRDFDDPRRDWQRTEMAGEARLGPVTRLPGFPVAVPEYLFADYAADSGTGIVITDCVPYGEGEVEPHRRKCLDWQHTPEPLPYYRATVSALARLAGADKAGHLCADIETRFPVDKVAASADRVFTSEAEMEEQLAQCADIVARAPQLFPETVRDPAFLAKFAGDVRAFRAAEEWVQAALTGDPAFIALNHWNAHIDNCFFRRDAAGGLSCGFIDWGRVGRITLGSALWGGLSAAHHAIWDDHLDEILALFRKEYAGAGGPRIQPAALLEHLRLHIGMMGTSRVIAFPEVIRFRLPEAIHAAGPQDPVFHAVDPARNCLHVFTVFLKFWHRHDPGAALERLLAGDGV